VLAFVTVLIATTLGSAGSGVGSAAQLPSGNHAATATAMAVALTNVMERTGRMMISRWIRDILARGARHGHQALSDMGVRLEDGPRITFSAENAGHRARVCHSPAFAPLPVALARLFGATQCRMAQSTAPGGLRTAPIDTG
jgi:hypothetical protein